jgi:hypothetical protein
MSRKNSSGWKNGRRAGRMRARLRRIQPRIKPDKTGCRRPSRLEAKWALVWRVAGGPELEVEHEFAPPRKWRFDFAHPETKVAVEIHGGTWSGGRHVRGTGMAADCAKLNAAQMMGWTVFVFTAEMIRLQAAEMVRDVIHGRLFGMQVMQHENDGDRRFIRQAVSLLGNPVNARIAASFRAGLFALGYNGTEGGATIVAEKEKE